MTNSNPFDIVGRLVFLGLGPKELDTLQGTREDVAAALPSALDSFYATIRKSPSLSRMFSSSTQMRHARSQQLNHWLSIVSDRFEGGYLKTVERIGATHARLGLEPRWYIAGNSLLIEQIVATLIHKAWKERPPSGLFGRKDDGSGADDLAKRVGLLIKATMLDMELAVTSALTTVETQRKHDAAEQEAALGLLATALESVAEGNLSVTVDARLGEKSPPLAAAFEKLISGLTGLISAVRDNSEHVEASAKAISSESRAMAKQMDAQAADLDSLSRTIDDVTEAIKRVADQTRMVSEQVTDCSDQADWGQKIVNDATTAIEKITESSGRISQIIGLIDDLSLQTNLLALNAGVEAARAGTAGKGFAVVAQEIRGLAIKSTDAAKQIKSLIRKSGEDVEEGVMAANAVGTAISTIRQSVRAVGELIEQIADATGTQAARVDEINSRTTRFTQETRRNAHVAQHTSQAGQDMETSSLHLTRLVSSFRLSESHRLHPLPTRPIKVSPHITTASMALLSD